MAQPLGRLVRTARSAADLRWRQPPRLRVGDRPGPSTVYYLTPHFDSPSGGVRNNYRHVDTLNSAGIPAAVLHAKAGFRCAWFAHDTRIAYPAQVTLGAGDVLVVPECYGPGLHRLPPAPQVMVFNQRAHATFDLIPYESTEPGAPYSGVRNLSALIAVSQDNVSLLEFGFPGLPVHLTRLVVNGDIFHPAARPAGRRMAFVTHRRAQERHQLLHLLRAHGVLDGWELVPIKGRTERETAQIMRTCAIFLSFSEREGFGLPPAEAMASGCFVVGYTGQAGREFFDPGVCAPVADGDLAGFAQAVADAVRSYDMDPDALFKRGLAASELIRQQYSQAGLHGDLVRIFGHLRQPVPGR